VQMAIANQTLQAKQTRIQRTRFFAFCLLPFAFFFTSCGKIGAPIPPARLTERASDLSAIQRGSKILLSWSPPALGKKESTSSYVERVDIYRLLEKFEQEPVLDEDDYETSAKIIGTMDRATIEAQVQTLGNLQFSDNINLDQARVNVRLRYAVRYVNKRWQQAAFSNTVAIEPVALIAASPTNLKIANQQQDAITLSWSAPDSGAEGTSSATTIM